MLPTPRFARSAVIGTLVFTSLLSMLCSRARADDELDARAAAKAFAKAAEGGDVKAAKAMSIFTKEEEPIVEGMVTMASAGKRYIDAAVKRFGKEAETLKAPGTGMARRIDAADVTVQDDIAVVGSDVRPLLMLRKVGNAWKFDVSSLNDKVGLSRTPQLARLVKRMLGDLTTDLDTGKFKTLADLQSAKDAKMKQLARDLDKEDEPMQPTTNPAKP